MILSLALTQQDVAFKRGQAVNVAYSGSDSQTRLRKEVVGEGD